MELWEQIKNPRPVVPVVRLSLVSPETETLEGTLCLTAFHFIFSTRKKAEEELTVLHTSIASIERRPPANTTALVILLKDFRRFILEFQTTEECSDVADAMDILSRPDQFDQLHAVLTHRRDKTSSSSFLMEDVYGLFRRWLCPSSRWRVSICNEHFKVCPSYTKEVIVPASISDEQLQTVAAYRHGGRFPVLCYHHLPKKSALMRCGQPLMGSGQKRCRADVQLLNACLQSVGKGRVFDTRSQQQAHHHTGKGGGVELPSLYPQWKVEYGGLESIHHLQSSLNKLLEACGDSSLWMSSSWFARLEGSGWLTHVEKLLKAVRTVVQAIHKDGVTVVVHGRGGRDSTLQVTALAQVLLDPHCRTIHGFLELVQREWLDGGHPFSVRHNHLSSSAEKEKGPVFLLFLDALWQVMQQYPLSFEFNENLLHTLFTNSYSSDFTTFLFDNSRLQQLQGTRNLWDHMFSPKIYSSLLNPLYDKNNGVLCINLHPCSVVLWKEMYLKSSLSVLPSLPAVDTMRSLKEENKALLLHLQSIRKELEELQSEGRTYSTVWR